MNNNKKEAEKTVEEYLDELFQEAKVDNPIMMEFINKFHDSITQEIKELDCKENVRNFIEIAWADVALMNPLLSNKMKEQRFIEIIRKTITQLKYIESRR